MGNKQAKNEKDSWDKFEKECLKKCRHVEKEIMKSKFKYKKYARQYVHSLAVELNRKYPDYDTDYIYKEMLNNICYVTWDRLL